MTLFFRETDNANHRKRCHGMPEMRPQCGFSHPAPSDTGFSGAGKPLSAYRTAFSGMRESMFCNTKEPFPQHRKAFSAKLKWQNRKTEKHNPLAYRQLRKTPENHVFAAGRTSLCKYCLNLNVPMYINAFAGTFSCIIMHHYMNLQAMFHRNNISTPESSRAVRNGK